MHFDTFGDLTEHYKMTDGTINELLLRYAVPKELGLDHLNAASSIGVAEGITRLLKASLKTRLADIDPGFPRDLLLKHGIYSSSLVRRNPWIAGEALAPVVRDMAVLAQSELQEGLQVINKLTKSDLFLHTVATIFIHYSLDDL